MRGQTRSRSQQQQTELGHDNDSRTVDQVETAEHGYEQKPEPQEHVDLLVDDVQWQHAEPVQLLDGTRWTVFVERALGYFGKDAGHRVGSVFGFHFGETQHVGAVRAELALEEVVHEEYLGDDVDEVEELAQEEAYGVEVLRVQIGREVVDEQLLAVRLALLADDRTVEVQHEHLDAAALPGLPHVPGQVEEHRLEEQDEAHPLVVLVVLDLVLALHVRRDAGLDDVLTDAGSDPVGYGERGVNPAVGVHDVERHIVHDAVDRVADVLSGSDEQRERHQDDDGRLVVQSEYVVVDAHVVDLEQPLYGAENVEHVSGRRSSRARNKRHGGGTRRSSVNEKKSLEPNSGSRAAAAGRRDVQRIHETSTRKKN